MTRDVIVPPERTAAMAATGFSPAIRAGDFVYLTGATGGSHAGMPEHVAEQTRNALAKAETVLAAAGGELANVVEMTTYHTHLRDDFDTVDPLLRELLGEPLPAWTAVEVAGLRRPGARIELRLVAHVPL